jgi:hypothetical protein
VKSTDCELPVCTASTVLPLGVPLLENAVDPWYATRRSPAASATAVNVVAETPEPHENAPDEMPQAPLDVLMVKPVESPERLMVAKVLSCVSQPSSQR